ncbi:MAG TPA: DUF4331 domain-containing protein [Chloroflexia bacterium]|nr:DUF4331 domain-containing protein [Chloroflexia bacterium]
MKLTRILNLLLAGVMVLGLAAFGASTGQVGASSHREAPMIIADPEADNTDVYAFVSPDKPDTATIVANFNPFENPGNGPNFYRFGDDIMYEIHVDNVGDAQSHITYQFRFTTQIANPNTSHYNTGPIESIDSPNVTFKQYYTVTRLDNGNATTLGQNLLVPPYRVGPKSTPNYEALWNAGIYDLNDSSRVFAGPADDSFFLDFSIFDLLSIRKLPGNAGGGRDSLRGFNVQTIAIQVPMTRLTANGTKPAAATDANAVIGVWSTTSRQATSVLRAGQATQRSGEWIQVSRLGSPLVNEVVVPMGAKDLFNSSQPANDAQFLAGVTDPELPKLLNALYNIKVPPAPRDDLVAIFLTGIKGATMPPNVKPSEELRLNLGVPPSANPNRLGVIGGDLAGFPNGRRLADDVFDVSLKAVAGAAYPLFHPDFTPDPLAAQLGDGVDGNDVSFRATFPYVALPHEGTINDPFNETGSQGGGGTTGGGTSGTPGMPRTGGTDSGHLADVYGTLFAVLVGIAGLAVVGGWTVRRRTAAQTNRQ